MRLRDKEKAAIIIQARRLDMNDGREVALLHLMEHGMGGSERNGRASAHRILDYRTFRYIDCVPREHPLWREWRAEEDRAIESRRKARQHRPKLMERTGGKCEWCGNPVSGSKATIDHIDGDKSNNALDNLALLCRSCNGRKSNGSLERLASIEQRNEHYAAINQFYECPCHMQGCPPYCTGCEVCAEVHGHTVGGAPTEISCPNWIDLAYSEGELECDEAKCRDAGECLLGASE